PCSTPSQGPASPTCPGCSRWGRSRWPTAGGGGGGAGAPPRSRAGRARPWHWDLEQSAPPGGAYRRVLGRVFEAAGFEPLRTDEPEIAYDPANLFVARVGSRVPPARRAALTSRLVRPRTRAGALDPPPHLRGGPRAAAAPGRPACHPGAWPLRPAGRGRSRAVPPPRRPPPGAGAVRGRGGAVRAPRARLGWHALPPLPASQRPGQRSLGAGHGRDRLPVRGPGGPPRGTLALGRPGVHRGRPGRGILAAPGDRGRPGRCRPG